MPPALLLDSHITVCVCQCECHAAADQQRPVRQTQRLAVCCPRSPRLPPCLDNGVCCSGCCVHRDFSLQFHLTRKEVASRSSARQEALEARATLTPLVPSFLDIPADLSSSYMPEAPQSSPTLTRTRSPTGFLSGTIPDTLTLTHHGLDAVVAEGAAAHLNGTSVALAHLNVGAALPVSRSRCVLRGVVA